VGMVREARCRARIPVFVIVRPRGGDFLYPEAEFESMRQNVIELKELGAPGIDTGCLTADGEMDKQRAARLLRLARPMSFTFHRAFDMVRDPVQVLEVLISLGVDRLLTSGQRATAIEGLATLKRLGQVASGRMIVMPCGGLRADNVGRVCRETGLWELHFAAHTMEPSAMTYRNPQVAMGATARDHEYRKTVTDPATVRTTVEAARNELK